MKKFLSVILATAILFSLCVSSAFATIDLSTNDNPDWSYYYENSIIAEGWLKIEVDFGRSIFYGVTFTNITNSHIIYDVNIQCAATYADGTQDYDSANDTLSFMSGEEGQVCETLYLPFNDTLVNVDAEFRIGSSGNMKWWGLIYQTYTPGIDT